MTCVLVAATAADANALAQAHTDSWRSAYRGILADEFLDRDALGNRQAFWNSRLNQPAPDRRLILLAKDGDALIGFVCVLLDADPQWGVRLDNLHVKPSVKGTGIGKRLFDAARTWATRAAPGTAMHLWVIESNHPARRFYERQAGAIADQRVRELVPGIEVAEVRYLWPPMNTQDGAAALVD